MKNSKLPPSAQSYLESLQQETKKLLSQKQGKNILPTKKVKKNLQKKGLSNKKSGISNDSFNVIENASSIDSDDLDEDGKRRRSKKSRHTSKDKDSSTSHTSNELSSNQNCTEKGNDELSDSNRYSIASIPADKYLKMIRYSIDTSLFMGTKNDVNSNEISPLSSNSNSSIKNINKPFNHKNDNEKEIKKSRNNFKIGSLISKSERQETIMEANDIEKNDNVVDKKISIEEKTVIPISAFRKQPIVMGGTKNGGEKNSDLLMRNKNISFDTSLSEIIYSDVEKLNESVSSSISTIKQNYKSSKEQSSSTSISTSLSSISSLTKVTSSSSKTSKTDTSSVTTLSSSSSSSSSTEESSENSSTDSSEDSSSSETLSTSSNSTSKTLTKKEKSIVDMDDTLNSFDELSSIKSYISGKSKEHDIKYFSEDSDRSSKQSFYSIPEEEFKNDRKNIYKMKGGTKKTEGNLKDIKMDILGYQKKLSLLEDKKNIKFNKDEVLKNILIPYIHDLKKYVEKEEKVSKMIESNLYSIFCKDSTEKALQNIFSQS